jgi:DNA-binding NarL/FixJ family response regulator
MLDGNGFHLALVDCAGRVRFSEPDFASTLRLEWSSWDGAALPQVLVDVMRAATRTYVGGEISVELRPAGDMFFVKARRRWSLDGLAPRERTVAVEYSRGLTHKEIARALSVSPETVRKQIQQVYRKLGVRDKAELATLLAASQ